MPQLSPHTLYLLVPVLLFVLSTFLLSLHFFRLSPPTNLNVPKVFNDGSKLYT